MNSFEVLQLERRDFVNHFASEYSKQLLESATDKNLVDAVLYSLNGNGKRFRPVLGLFFAEAFGAAPNLVMPWCFAVEMVHTYSLIHDDLPCMDNDDFRRGQPTNHKVFGEANALLAGDALLTESFLLIAKSYQERPSLAVELIKILSTNAGINGMIGGQSLDIKIKSESFTQKDLLNIQINKTAALIRAITHGVALVIGLPAEQVAQSRIFGESLGLAFQIKDDWLDSQDKIEPASWPHLIGLEKTNKYLQDVSNESMQTLKNLNIHSGPLFSLINYNLERLQ
jgi:geranylgeranyl diphosphate synthase, type II